MIRRIIHETLKMMRDVELNRKSNKGHEEREKRASGDTS